LVEQLKNDTTDKDISTRIAAVLSKMSPKRAPIEAIMELLKVRNAYVRNLAISTLRDYGDSIRYYIVKFLIGDDRDLRIFAINVLGDVNFAESREMLTELLQNEKDINVAMTAVDYLAEIGEEEDISSLNIIKDRFEGDAYVSFGVENAIRGIRG
jgi:HEAT repeat protein